MTFHYLTRHVTGCFSYDDEITDDCIDCFRVFPKGLKVYTRNVKPDLLDGFQNVGDAVAP